MEAWRWPAAVNRDYHFVTRSKITDHVPPGNTIAAAVALQVEHLRCGDAEQEHGDSDADCSYEDKNDGDRYARLKGGLEVGKLNIEGNRRWFVACIAQHLYNRCGIDRLNIIPSVSSKRQWKTAWINMPWYVFGWIPNACPRIENLLPRATEAAVVRIRRSAKRLDYLIT